MIAAADRRLGLDRHWRNARTHSVHDPVSWKDHHLGGYLVDGRLPPNHTASSEPPGPSERHDRGLTSPVDRWSVAGQPSTCPVCAHPSARLRGRPIIAEAPSSRIGRCRRAG
jgi:hypothetical protein